MYIPRLSVFTRSRMLKQTYKVRLCCLGFLILYIKIIHSYVIPKPRIELLTPRGIKVSIDDEPGLRLFAFHANINKEIQKNKQGDLNVQIYTKRNGRWTYEDENLIIRDNDVIHYWIYVQCYDEQYTTSEQTWSKKAEGSTTPENDTSHRLLLDENFDSFNHSIWSWDVRMPLEPDYEFCVYHNDIHENLKIEQGKLRIAPSILEDSYGENILMFGQFELAGCTSNVALECSRKATSFSILPPIISARLTTKEAFYFKYGKIEIRAKFPQGDWLYPELWLEPKYSVYGSKKYESGRIFLGFARGNENLVSLNNVAQIFDSRKLEFGIRTGSSSSNHMEGVSLIRDDTHWTQDFHVYTTIWDSKGFTFLVDNQQVGKIRPPSDHSWVSDKIISTGKNAPFDQEFYLSFGLGVGGVRMFPDKLISSGYEKPWTNTSAKAMLKFWRTKGLWYPSWGKNGDLKSTLQIDYVRVWSL